MKILKPNNHVTITFTTFIYLSNGYLFQYKLMTNIKNGQINHDYLSISPKFTNYKLFNNNFVNNYRRILVKLLKCTH